MRQVLLIEDEANIAEALRFILSRDGWAVSVVADGALALAEVARLRPDLVILDTMLPGMSGLEILTALRADPANVALPILMLTAKGQSVTLTRRASGAYDPATGTAPITETTQTGKGVILPLASGVRHSGNTNIPVGAMQFLLSAQGITTPHLDDTMTDVTGKVWAIIEVSPLASAGDAVLYDLTIKGAA